VVDRQLLRREAGSRVFGDGRFGKGGGEMMGLSQLHQPGSRSGKEDVELLDPGVVAPGPELLGDEQSVGVIVGRAEVVGARGKSPHPVDQIFPPERGIELGLQAALPGGTVGIETQQRRVIGGGR